MDLRHNVNDTDDSKRRSPPVEQPQSGHSGFLPELMNPSDYRTDSFNGYDGTDMTYGGIPSGVERAVQDILEPPMSQGYNDPTSRNDAFLGTGFDCRGLNDAPVNGYGDPGSYDNFFTDLDMPHDGQTFFDFSASDNLTHPFPNQDLPQFGSGNLTDRPFPEFTFSSHTHAASPAPVPAHIGGTFIPPNMDEGSTQTPLPPTSPAMDSSRRPRRRRAASMDSRDTTEPSRVKKQCAGCQKAFYSSKDPNGLRCTRCYDKHVKHTAGHTTYVFDPEMTIDHAWRRLYPNIEPLAPAGDDVEAAKSNELDYIRRLIEAVSIPYTSDGSGSKEDQQRLAQQFKMNKKPFDSTQYRDDLVNARIRFLFHISISYHAGGPSLYDLGGDNSGYGEDRTLKFSERIERIIQLLRLDKDIAMDVIEGRGVTALVHNPNKYQRRKRDNKKSNDTKQDLQEKGKQLHMLEASASASASPAPPPEPALGQRVNLPTHISGAHGNLFSDSGATAQFHPSFSGLRMPGFGGSLRSEGESGNAAARAHLGDMDRYVPAQFE
ncbi:hypothetical protein MBLNU13_g10026t1 [Cladosporium sp. NU13]